MPIKGYSNQSFHTWVGVNVNMAPVLELFSQDSDYITELQVLLKPICPNVSTFKQ